MSDQADYTINGIPVGDWVSDAHCGDKTPTRLVCAGCPVLEQCLDYALLATPATDALWGGATGPELQHIRIFGKNSRNRHLDKLRQERAHHERVARTRQMLYQRSQEASA